MEKFTILEGIVAPLDIDNVDTDMIIPKQFLKVIKREGLGKNLFDEMRYDRAGEEISDFVLNREPYRASKILVSGKNFGCGSSREHAPWALKDFGIRCIIAESYADIFYNNCFKNSILPITLSADEVRDISAHASTSSPEAFIDLQAQSIRYGDKTIFFELDPTRKDALLTGLDDIAKTLQSQEDISAFEQKDAQIRPWLAARGTAV